MMNQASTFNHSRSKFATKRIEKEWGSKRNCKKNQERKTIFPRIIGGQPSWKKLIKKLSSTSVVGRIPEGKCTNDIVN